MLEAALLDQLGSGNAAERVCLSKAKVHLGKGKLRTGALNPQPVGHVAPSVVIWPRGLLGALWGIVLCAVLST